MILFVILSGLSKLMQQHSRLQKRRWLQLHQEQRLLQLQRRMPKMHQLKRLRLRKLQLPLLKLLRKRLRKMHQLKRRRKRLLKRLLKV
jgi:hypothetical protein